MRTAEKRIKFQPSKYIVLFLLIFLTILMTIMLDNFFTFNNIKNIFASFSVYGVTTIAMTYAIICAEFDLSVGSIMAFTSLVFANLANSTNLVTAIIVSLLVGLMFGALNGVIVAVGKVSSFVATLGTQIAIKGLALYYTDGYQVPIYSTTAYKMGNGELLGIPYLVLFFFLMLSLAWYVLKYTRFGRNLYAVGGNYDMAKLAGIKSWFYKFMIFVILGFCASISGIMIACRVASGNALHGADLTMTAVAAVVVGGTSLNGGSGGVWRTLAGLLVIYLLFNPLTLLGLSAYWQQFLKGLIVIIVIVADALIQRHKED